MLIFNNFKN